MKQKLLKTCLMVVMLLVGVGTTWASDPVKCTSTSDLVAGSVYYISGADTYSSTATVMGLSTGGNNFPASTFGGTPCELTLGGDATNGWTFSYVDGSTTYYLDPTNTTGSNYLKRNTSVTDYGKFTISFSNGAAVITSKGKSSRNIVRYNSSSSCYSCYSSGQGAVYLYKKATTPTVAYTVTFNAGDNGTCETSSLTEESAGAGVTLPGVTAKEGWSFQGWSTSSTPTSADAGAADATYKPSADITLYAYYKVIPVAPTFSTAAGPVEKGTTINFSSTTDGCTYRYTTDGTNPDAKAGTEGLSFVVNDAANLKVVAIKDGVVSAVSSASYTVATHTVTFNVNGNVTNAQVANGDAIPFPADPSIDDVVFMGWTTSPIDGTQNNAPSMVNKATATMGTNDVTYYAVFATEEDGGTAWKKVAASAVNSAGTYAIITTDGHAFNGTISSGHGQLTSTAFSFDASGNATSAPEGTCEITFIAVTGGYTMYNASNGYLYASAASSGKLAWHNTESSYWLYKSSNWLYNSNSAYLRDYQNSSIRTYGANNGSVIQFAKKVSSTTYSDYCTTVSSKATPTLSFAETTCDATMGEDFTAPTLTNEQGVTVSYASSDEGVATVDENTGVVELVAPGTTTITASFAGNETYKSASVSYTLKVAAAKHAVTFDETLNGTITVKAGETVINDGDRVSEGTTLTIECTPTDAENYRFKNWQYKVGEGSWNTVYTNPYNYTMPSANVQFRANFELIPTYTVAFSVNGSIVQSENLKEGDAVTAPADPEAINDKVFTGWIKTATVEGATPAYVTPITTATETVTYYAVFATRNGSGSQTEYELNTSKISTYLNSSTRAYADAEGTYDDGDVEWGYVGYTQTKNADFLQIRNTAPASYVSFDAPDNITKVSFGVTNGNDRNFSGTIYIKTSADATSSTNDENIVGKASVDGKSGEATITGNHTKLYMQASGTARITSITLTCGSNPTYSDYCTIVPEVLTLGAQAGGTYYATFSNSKAVEFTDARVYTVSVDGNNIQLNEQNSKQVPANNGVLISSTSNKVYYNVISEASALGDNLLMPAGDAGITAQEMDDANSNCKFYRLAYNNYEAKTGLGFYWGADNGAAFSCKAGTAYLAVPNSQTPARGYSFDGEETAIESAIAEQMNQGVMYDLQGRRAKAGQHGIFIVNGKKVVR